ncbi:hypothetical protein Tco_1567606, partial [Tanacetum coccineum]
MNTKRKVLTEKPVTFPSIPVSVSAIAALTKPFNGGYTEVIS